MTAIKEGKKYCPHCKGIEEVIVEQAFIQAFNIIKSDDKSVLESFISKVEESLNEQNVTKKLEKIEKELNLLENKKMKLVDTKLEGVISKEDFESKYSEIMYKIESKKEDLAILKNKEETQNGIQDKIKTCRIRLEENDKLESFDRIIFESIIERVIIGGFDDKGNIDPYRIIFVLKTGSKVNISPLMERVKKSNPNENMKAYQLLTHDTKNPYQHNSVVAYGDITHIEVFKNSNIISNGHHRVSVLLKYGIEYVNVYYI